MVTVKRNMSAIASLLLIIFTLSACSAQDNSYSYDASREDAKDQENISEPENPYSSGSGHSAGYEWAERTGGGCNGNSSSFNEGCEEYYSQMDE